MRQVLDKRVPRRLAAAVMAGGFVIGAAVGYIAFDYRWFDGGKHTNQSPSFTEWIFPSMSPLVSPPTEFPVVQPPTEPPPR